MFKNKNYTKIFMATLITRFGDSIDSIALSWLVYVLTGSKLLMGTLFAISFIPNILLLPISGVIADLISKRKITWICDLLRGASVCIFALIYFLDFLEVWHLFLFVVINSTLESLSDPARSSLLPLIVDEEDYVSANGYLSTASTIGNLIGVGAAGLLIGMFGIWFAIFIDGITFFLASGLIYLLKIQEKVSESIKFSEVKFYFQMIIDGLAFLRRDRIITSFVIFAALFNFTFVPFNVLQPVYVDQVMNMGPVGMSYLGGGLLIGMLVGGLIIGSIGKKIEPIRTVSFCLSILALCYGMLGAVHYISLQSSIKLGVIVITSFIFGMMLPIAQAPIGAVIMKRIPVELTGRVLSIFTLISLSMNPLGGSIVGVIGESLSVSQFFILMGIMGLIVSIGFRLFHIKTDLNIDNQTEMEIA